MNTAKTTTSNGLTPFGILELILDHWPVGPDGWTEAITKTEITRRLIPHPGREGGLGINAGQLYDLIESLVEDGLARTIARQGKPAMLAFKRPTAEEVLALLEKLRERHDDPKEEQQRAWLETPNPEATPPPMHHAIVQMLDRHVAWKAMRHWFGVHFPDHPAGRTLTFFLER